MIMVRSTYSAVVSIGPRTGDIVASTTAIPATSMIIIRGAADIDGAVAMR